MREGWETKPLGEVIRLEYGKPLPKEKRTENGHYPVYGANGVKSHSEEYYWDKPSIIVGRKGSAGEVVLSQDVFWPLDVTYFVVYDDCKYDRLFLFYALKSLHLNRLAKVVKPGLNRNEVYSIDFPTPPLPEQKRIVAILDEAFAAIETAVANAEKNLANARELFDSYLNGVFSRKGDGWEEKRLGDVCTLQRGFDLPKRLRIQGRYPLVSSSGYIDSHIEAKVSGPGVVTGRSGSVGAVFYVEDDFWPLNTTLYVKDFHGNNPKFIYHLVKSFHIERFSSGAGVPTLNRNNVHSEPLWITSSLVEQQSIVEKLRVLTDEIQNLETIYQQKLASLAELKQSILQKAFSMELTGEVVQTKCKDVI